MHMPIAERGNNMTPKPEVYSEPDEGWEKDLMEHTARKKYTDAQSYLVRKVPVLGIPLLEKLPSVMSYNVKAMATDGTKIIYNPSWVVEQPLLELVHVIAHEVAHVSFKHMTRRKHRDQDLWNVATDYQVNSYLHLMGVGQKPKNCLFSLKYNGMTMTSDAIYEDLVKRRKPKPEKKKPSKKESDTPDSDTPNPDSPQDSPIPDNDSAILEKEMEIAASYGWVDDYSGSDPEVFGMDGEYRDTRSDADIQELEDQVDEAMVHGEFAHQKIAGKEPAVSINDMISPSDVEVVNWEDALQEFLTEKVKDKKNWNRPNKRWLQQGFWLPSKSSYSLKDIIIMNDESGSMSVEENQACLTNIDDLAQQGIISFDRLVVMHFTTTVGEIEYFETGDDIKYIRHSSGGTCFRTVFDKAKDMECEGLIDPSCYIVMTDMYDDFPTEPEQPVLWMSVTDIDTLYSYNSIPEYGKITHLKL
mgnify:FL=1